jgi:hypothetical protein
LDLTLGDIKDGGNEKNLIIIIIIIIIITNMEGLVFVHVDILRQGVS